MRVLFNCSTNIVGGGLKNSALFIKNAIHDSSVDWFFAISAPIAKLLNSWDIDCTSENFFIFNLSPARNISSRTDLINFAKNKNVDLVYTMAGPAYVSFHCKHVMGISNAYITHADFDAYKLKGSFFNVLRYFLYTSVQFLYSYKADYYIFQTDYSKNNFSKRSLRSKSRMFVVPNAYDDTIRKHFKSNSRQHNENLTNDKIQIFCPGAAYIHKGFQFLPKTIFELTKRSNVDFEFVVTLPEDSEIWVQMKKELKELNVSQYCRNIGPYIYSDLLQYLETCHVVYVPSLLETFSASYLEAMCAKKKLVVANKSFAIDICDNFAVYTNPKNSISTTNVFNSILNELKLSMNEIELADSILDLYGNQENRFRIIKNLLINLATK